MNRQIGNDFVLKKDEIHVWHAQLGGLENSLDAFLEMLSKKELKRAHSFKFEKDRNKYIAGHGILRILLGRYTNLEPGKIQFSYGEFGKPGLAGLEEGEGLQFNYSQSGDAALCAFTIDGSLGVDIEKIRHIP
ncbi:MAG: 4'-phosphopantetheinyl transferase, partial [Proteobacteria bacterium]|nr:4'-phosphopantetheinyl transferase [Pseudomonadota bacterium]